jgi:hypothetical protein
MKRSVLFLTAFFSALSAISQDYQCVRAGAEYYFTDSILFHAIRIDSVVPEGENLVYYNYFTMAENDTDQYCYTRFGPSWIGKKVTVKPDGKNFFYNRIDSTITIETLKNPGETWTCYHFANGNYIEASVAEIQEMEFLTLTDSVKRITFQVYNSGGTPITHTINDKYLLLSKNYGLVRTINFKLFPEFNLNGPFYDQTCTEFDLYGISNPQVGKQNMNAAQVYNFDVGDEIDTHREYHYSGGYSEEDKLKYYILEKDYSQNYDTVIYLVHKCGWTQVTIPYQGGYIVYYKDTLNTSYALINDTIIRTLPDEVVIDKQYGDTWDYYVTTSNVYQNTGRQYKTVWGQFYSIPPHECIEVFPSKDEKEFGCDKKYYIEGLGFYFSYQDQIFSVEWTSPVYYYKNNETWGIPWVFTCENLPVNNEELEVAENSVSISPNPMHSIAAITIPNDQEGNYLLQLYNSTGLLVRESQFQSGEFEIQRGTLNDGIYFYLLKSENQVIANGKLVIQ